MGKYETSDKNQQKYKRIILTSRSKWKQIIFISDKK